MLKVLFPFVLICFSFVGFAQPVINVDNVVDVTCFGDSDGAINVTITGGIAPYTYDWDNDGTGDFDDPEDLSGLTAGTYTLIVVDDLGTSDTLAITVNSPTELVLSITNASNESCAGADGSFQVTATGGTPSYLYSIDNNITQQASGLYTGLFAGIYEAITTDNNGCTDTVLVAISSDPPFSVSLTVTPESCTGAGDGAITTVTNGSPPVVFDWDTDGVGDFDDPQDLTGLSEGTYTLTAIDGNGCIDGGSVYVNVSTAGGVEFDVDSITPVDCNNNPVGEIFISNTLGTPPFTFDWDNDGTGDNDDTEDLTGLTAGSYNLLVEDGAGCQLSLNVVVPVDSPLEFTIDNTVDVHCNGTSNGSISISPVNGTAPYTYDWNNDGTGDFDDPQDLTAISAGSYQVIIQDNLGCLDTLNEIIYNAGDNGTYVQFAVDSIHHLNCFYDTTGAVYVSSILGTAPFLFDWSNDGTGDYDDTEDMENLGSGFITLNVEDAEGCNGQLFVVVNFDSNPQITSTLTDPSCWNSYDGVVDVEVYSALAPITYDWSFDGTGDYDDPQDLNNFPSGTYNLVVEDAAGCHDTASFVLDGGTVGQIADIGVLNDSLYAIGTGTYQWYNCDKDSIIDGATDSYFIVTTPGHYAVIIDDGNCPDTSNCAFITEVGSGIGFDENEQLTFKVYPNPANDYIQLDLSINSGEIEIRDIEGRMVMLHLVESKQSLISIDQLENGVYFVIWKNQDSVITERVVVSK
ncbi:T9SS type A sorting domain-containing protein [Paracrocinitomix mangrovi]|uniref:T9SS type A sorting domain-containing protein n=1 Tax=Paracrocinitomix mangrovi TaxID=2862509 RepID=UPI001C8E2103|nr:T9SS type A sorting domain-containing protein [Paracrocinitomix mangrovi]UKN01989.1 T9SS type A sorting domain-containing protein [Paracrocinitomix mangrovi]